MSADPRDLTTVANLQFWLGLTNVQPATATQLQRLVTAVSVWMQDWMNRIIPSQSYQEFRDGNDQARLMLPNYPVTAIAAVTVDGVIIPPSPGPGQSGWVLANDTVTIRCGRFTRGKVNVEVDYTAGYATTPPDLEQACLELASLRWKDREHIGHNSISMGGQQTNFVVKDMPDSVKTVLQQYKKVVPC